MRNEQPIFTPEQARAARREAADELYFALDGLLAEFEKFSRYGSPIAHAANDKITYAKRALAKARGETPNTGGSHG